jgi:hypothetical protein
MFDAGPHVVANGGEVNVGDLLLVAEGLDVGSDGRVVRVVDPGEEMMFNLVVETTVETTKPCATNVG